jgi:signal transduction histidine kinase
VVSAYLLVAATACAVFALTTIIAIEAIESEIINARLAVAADELISRFRQGQSTQLTLYPELLHGGAIPVEMRGLGPGLHEVETGAQEFTVFVRFVDDEQFVVVDDQRRFEGIEDGLELALALGGIVCLLLALLLGRITANRVVAPVTALADAVARDSWSQDLPSLDDHDEIGVLARALAARAAELREYLERERFFTGDVSHELRTPLTVILGAAELLSAQLQEHPKLLSTSERIRRTALDMTERVNTLLLLSRSPESLDAPRVALTPIIKREFERCRALLEGKPVSLVLDAPAEAWVSARPELVSTAVGNLLRNACQFTEQGEVTIRLRAGSLVVEDTGAGIPDSVRERLFERFVRGREGHGIGSGLGLAIVKRVADHLGWSIEMHQRSEGGTRFTLEFPD